MEGGALTHLLNSVNEYKYTPYHTDSSWTPAYDLDQWVNKTKYCQVSLKPAGTTASGVGAESSQP